MIRSALLATALAVAAASVPVRAQAQQSRQLSPKQEQGERKALAAFAAGRYDEAVQIYSELYADYRDPVYLRNIGRCYQKLRDPDKAISSFEEYLARAKKITPTEQDEVRGFIRDLQALKQQKPAEPAPRPAEPAPPANPSPPPAVAPSPVTPLPAAVQPDVTAQPAPSGGSSAMRIAGWGAVGLAGALAVAGSVTWASANSKYSDADMKCRGMDCFDAADSIESRSTASKLLFAGAVVSGVAGGVLLYLGTDRSGSGEIAGLRLGARGTF